MLMRNPTRCDIYTRDRQRICIYVGFTCLCFRCEEFKIIYKIKYKYIGPYSERTTVVFVPTGTDTGLPGTG